MAEKQNTLLLTGIIVALFFSVNLLFDEFNISLDLSENRLFSLSPQSYTVMDGLSQEVTIYGLYQTGDVNKLIDEILRRYSTASRKIQIKYIDPIRNPDFVKSFVYQGNEPSENSLIISAGKLFKVLSEADLFEIGMDVQRRHQVRSLVVEERVTGALLYVDGGIRRTIAELKGHGEAVLPQILTKSLRLENYELIDLDLRSELRVPDHIDVLAVNLPDRDLSPGEAESIGEFIEAGGNGLFLVGPILSGTPNLGKLLSAYGIELTNALVTENDAGFYTQIPIFLMPRQKPHDILDPIASADMRTIVPFSQSLDILKLNDTSIQTIPLLVTSEKARLRDNGEAGPEGPFTIAAAATLVREGTVDKESRIVVVGSGAVSDPDILRDVPANVNFILNGFNWLAGQNSASAIRPKSLLSFRLAMDRRQSLIYSGIAVILIPLLIFGAGLGVWLWRRRL
ncbi:MAG: GldG family protein [Spirochaetales bacterium]|jgi:ABC-2 type transport system permease protein|nr:GldG family protein [Spirochaetales bacterium]